jgi:GTPase
VFIDRARITAIAGSGGNGCVAFRREKFVPRGGPSGGDGGRGGDIFLECSDRVNTLIHFQYKRIFKAQRGRHGEGDRKSVV